MAEKIVDTVCHQLNITAPCTTATTVLPTQHGPKLHHLGDRLRRLEHGETPGALICECELVTAPQIRTALDVGGDVVSLNDLRRDLRLGMGPCQGGFCATRAAALRHEHLRGAASTSTNVQRSTDLLIEFANRRFSGMKPLLWGHNLRQALLAEQIYGRIFGLFGPAAAQTQPDFSGVTFPAVDTNTVPHRAAPRVVVIGGGLAGLTAALIANLHGARVEIAAAGQAALTLHPGWIETGDVPALAADPAHPYARTLAALPVGLAALHTIAPLYPAAFPAITGSGTRRPIAYTVGHPLPDLPPGTSIAVIGVTDWRDFYPGYAADHLRAAGYTAHTFSIGIPHRGGEFDDWPLAFAHYLDTAEGRKHIIEQVKPRLNRARVAAFPAILGLEMTTRAVLADALGIPVIELPTLPPAVGGLRWFRAIRSALLERGVRITLGPRVSGITIADGRAVSVQAVTAADSRLRDIPADAVILATGGLYSGGLHSGWKGELSETVLGAALTNHPPRADWYTAPLLSGERQPIHAVGVQVDTAGRPLNADGQPIAQNLYAVGRILGGYSPVQQGCAEGVDIASGAAAALAAAQALRLAAGI